MLAHPLIGAAVIGLAAMSAAAQSAAARQGSHGQAASAPAWSHGVEAATQLSQLPYLDPAAVAGEQSSFDRDDLDPLHAKADFGNFLATGRRGNVMLDQRGPGCVYRIFMASLQKAFPSDWAKIYLLLYSLRSRNLTLR